VWKETLNSAENPVIHHQLNADENVSHKLLVNGHDPVPESNVTVLIEYQF